MTSWLHRQRKADIVDLAQQAGMRGVANLKKDELIVGLEQHLHANASTLSNEPVFHGYFNRIHSPVKKETEAVNNNSSDAVTQSVRSREKQRVSSVEKGHSSGTDVESSPGPSTSLVSRGTRAIEEAVEPASRAIEGLASSLSLPIPPSPAAVADLVERRTSIAADNIRRYYSSHHIPRHVSSLREALSTVYALHSAFILFEAWGLQRTTLPWKYAFSLPSSRLTNDTPVRLHIPDFFVLLNGSFWAPTLLWVTTSILLPILSGWIINFSLVHGRGRRGGYDVDPLVFSIVKVLVTWLVYSQGQRFGGLFADTTVHLVESSVPGGWAGIVIGAGISALMSIYEAVLRR